MLTTIQGVYRDGKIELMEAPEGIADETQVIVTFLPCECEPEENAPQTIATGGINLRALGVDKETALRRRASLLHFEQFWNEPGDEVYDDYGAYIAKRANEV